MAMREIHLLPSRWDRNARTLVSALVRSKRMGAVACAFTETADGNRLERLTRAADLMGWKVLADQTPWWMAECSVAYDRDLKVIWWDTLVLGPDLGPGLPTVAILAVLEDPVLGLRYLVAQTHLPSAVEGDMSQGRPTFRVKAYQRAALNYRAAIRKANREHRTDVSLPGADWNLNALRPWARAYIQTLLPGHRVMRVRKGGTHGPRQIDLFLVRLSRKARRVLKRVRPVATRILPAHPHSDHRGVAARLRPRR